MPERKDSSLTFQVLHSKIFRWIFLVLTITFALISIFSMMEGLFQTGSQLAALASAFATILLVSLTAQYASLTQELVNESEKSRRQRKDERGTERQREVRALRRALHQEIQKIEGFDTLAEEYQASRSVMRLNAPMTIYQSNSEKIGLLSNEEIDSIVEYYTRLEHLEEMFRLQRKMDTTFDMDILTEYFAMIEAIVDKVFYIVTFGNYGDRGKAEREMYIQEQLEKLAETQAAALSAIEKNLEDE